MGGSSSEDVKECVKLRDEFVDEDEEEDVAFSPPLRGQKAAALN